MYLEYIISKLHPIKYEKQNNRINKITTTHPIYLEFLLHYIKIKS